MSSIKSSPKVAEGYKQSERGRTWNTENVSPIYNINGIHSECAVFPLPPLK